MKAKYSYRFDFNNFSLIVHTERASLSRWLNLPNKRIEDDLWNFLQRHIERKHAQTSLCPCLHHRIGRCFKLPIRAALGKASSRHDCPHTKHFSLAHWLTASGGYSLLLYTRKQTEGPLAYVIVCSGRAISHCNNRRAHSLSDQLARFGSGT